MKAFWAKITAWFMAILAFFTGLFSGGSKPPADPIPEPTTTMEQPTQEDTTQMEQTEIRYGVPAPAVSDSGIVCESAGGAPQYAAIPLPSAARLSAEGRGFCLSPLTSHAGI